LRAVRICFDRRLKRPRGENSFVKSCRRLGQQNGRAGGHSE
jgi:hypothetical protein